MAVSLNTGPTYGYSLLPLFGVDGMLAGQALGCGVTIEQSQPGAFSVTVDGVVVAMVTVKSTAITLAKSGSLGPASAAAIKYQFEAALKKAIAVAPKKSVDNLIKGGTTTEVGNLDEVDDLDEPDDLMTISKLLKANGEVGKTNFVEAVKLKEADKLLQSVTGTSHGSIYTVVALYDGLAVAIRKKPATLSVRVEGKNLDAFQSVLADVGMDYNGSYASAHFSVSDTPSRKKVVGAILGTFGFGDSVKVAPLDELL